MINTRYIDKTAATLKKLGNDFYNQGFKVPGTVNKTLFEHGNHMRNFIIQAMKNTKRASWFYKATKAGKKHNPSEPGYPPAVNTGELLRSYNFEVGKMSLEIGSTAKYSKWLEDGTSKMDARPVLDPTVEVYKDGIMEDLGNIARDISGEIFREAGVMKR